MRPLGRWQSVLVLAAAGVAAAALITGVTLRATGRHIVAEPPPAATTADLPPIQPAASSTSTTTTTAATGVTTPASTTTAVPLRPVSIIHATTTTTSSSTTSTTTTTRPDLSTPEGWAYISANEVIAVDLSTGRTSVLAANGFLPAVSPDRSHIAWVGQDNAADGASPWSVWVAAAGGTDAHRVSTAADGFEFGVVWSTDGTHLAYASRQGSSGPFEVVVVDATGGDRRQLTTNADVRIEVPDGVKLAWSPDGSHIAFVSDAGGGLDLVATATGTITTVPTPAGEVYNDLNWTPDGLALVADSLAKSSVVRIPINGPSDGSGVRILTPAGTYAFNAALSPDGSTVAFTTGHALDTIGVDGTGMTVVAPENDAGLGWPVAWSQDGSAILITESAPGGNETAFLRPPASAITVLHAGSDRDATW